MHSINSMLTQIKLTLRRDLLCVLAPLRTILQDKRSLGPPSPTYTIRSNAKLFEQRQVNTNITAKVASLGRISLILIDDLEDFLS